MKRIKNALSLAVIATGFACAAAHAAGGHHAVDDAAILEPGQCELEGWHSRAADSTRLVHAGLGCRVGPVELGMATERLRDSTGRATGYGLQVKWATEIAPGVSAGLSVSPAWQAHAHPRYQGSTVSGLVTWALREDVALHANIGRDLLHGVRDEKRYGVAGEWTPAPGWTLMAERYAESAGHFVRAGARWTATKSLSVDLSRAHRISGPAASNWTVGATWQFGSD